MKLRIEDRNADGRGRGREGPRTVLVSQAHPGEMVTVRVDKKTRGTLQGRVMRMLEPNEDRISHSCTHEFRCTGCPLLATPADEELAFKRERIRTALAGTIDLDADQPVVHRPGPLFGYRHGASQIFGRRGARPYLGSFAAGTHEVTDNEGCPVLAPRLAAAFDVVATLAGDLGLRVGDAARKEPGLRHVIGRSSASTGEVVLLIAADAGAEESALTLARAAFARQDAVISGAIAFRAAPGNVLLRGEVLQTFGTSTVTETMLGRSHAVGPASFFQVNPKAAEFLFERALELAGGSEGGRVIEGYAGSGALTAALADRFAAVDAIESNPIGVEHLGRLAAQSAGRIRVHAGRVQEHLPELFAAGPADLVLLDPPRAGLGVDLPPLLAAAPVQRILLLNCDPAALARDLPPLQGGGFQLRALEGVDQFPRTAHVETVALFERGSDSA